MQADEIRLTSESAFLNSLTNPLSRDYPNFAPFHLGLSGDQMGGRCQSGRLSSDNQEIRTQSSLQMKFAWAFDLILPKISSPQVYLLFLVFSYISDSSIIFLSRRCSVQLCWKDQLTPLACCLLFWSCLGLVKGFDKKFQVKMPRRWVRNRSPPVWARFRFFMTWVAE